MQETPIEWTGWTANPIRARIKASGKTAHWCQKISPGCKNCYASRLQPRFGGLPFEARFADQAEPYLDEAVLLRVLKRRKPTTIFWCDMTDMFGEWVPDEWIAAIFGVMALTPQHTHQVLTKRAERLPRWFDWIASQSKGDGYNLAAVPLAGLYVTCPEIAGPFPLDTKRALIVRDAGWPLKNVHLGVSVEDQQRADERIPHLLRTPAAVRWLSCEPLLGPVDLEQTIFRARSDELEEIGLPSRLAGDVSGTFSGLDPIRWVVIGGESGPGARGCDVAWIRNLKWQCAASNVPCFVKQLGSRPYFKDYNPNNTAQDTSFDHYVKFTDKKGGDIDEWPADLRVRQFPEVATR